MPSPDRSSHRHPRHNPRSTSHSRSRSRSRSRSPDRSDNKHHRSDRHRRHHRHHGDSHSHSHSHGHSHRDRDHRSHRHSRHHGHEHGHRHSRHHGHEHGHRSRRSERPSSSSHAPAPAPPAPVILPMQARELSKRDLPVYEPMFAMYLDIQKGIILEDLSEEEVKGRWKSFVGKWNRGLLAEGWYDPSTLEKARREAESQPPLPSKPGQSRGSPDYENPRDEAPGNNSNADLKDPREQGDAAEDEDEDDDYGPGIPTRHGVTLTGQQHLGPAIPTMQDLDLRNELAVEDALAARQDAQKYRRAEMQSHKSEVRQMEDEVAPRAEPGTHERRMEKRRETAAANRDFAQNRRGGSPTDAAPEEELMGSGADDLETMKKAQERDQRKKNEREIRREEILRARAAEREERLQQYRRKEDETIGWLKTLAKQRFG